jgi:hypothetical protein
VGVQRFLSEQRRCDYQTGENADPERVHDGYYTPVWIRRRGAVVR